MEKRFCHKCKKWRPINLFWSKHNYCLDCMRTGEKKALPKGGNVRLMVRIPEEVDREVRKIAKEREVTLSLAVADLLKGAIG